MREIKTFRQKDLVLNVSQVYDKKELDYSAWQPFVEKLCGDRDYQKESIKNAIIYLVAKNYRSLRDLAIENYADNAELREKYSSENDFIKKLNFPDKLYATLDLATGTGKSYVIYGIAQIALGLGLVDKVLVLCPSLTIESGLTEKFKQLSGSEYLRKALPADAKIKTPHITDANSTVKTGDICIENIHSVYETTGSSIEDSFIGVGKRTLVLNDEAHHIFNKVSGTSSTDMSIKKWKSFLLNPAYGFQYMLGFTGTAYIDDEYFNDVIYRYSLHDAIEDKMVKNVDYVQEDESKTSDEKFQKVYQNHRDCAEKYTLVKPLTILVTKNISKAKLLAEELMSFLAKRENRTKKGVASKVLLVTSNRDHSANVRKLKYVDDKNDPVEWIVSVSMLTEGWDVQNVFQIVPWEDRAFNSKLLIAQVLGRGLRIPESYQNPQPKVIVFNHKSWSSKIKKLLEDVLEIEKRIYSSVLSEDSDRAKYHFTIKNINYKNEPLEIKSDFEPKPIDFSRMWEDGVHLESQSITVTKSTTYISALGGVEREREYQIQNATLTIDEVLDKLFDEFEQREWEGKTLKLGENEYTQNDLPPREDIRKMIELSMKKRGNTGDLIIEKNAHKILNAFAPLLRKKNKTVISKSIMENDTFDLSTEKLEKQSTSVSNLRRDSSVFYADNWKKEIIDSEQQAIIQDAIDDDSFPRSAIKEKDYSFFKTPVNIVITSSKPERDFVDALCKRENAELITAWVKSRDRNFYEIEYSYRYGSDGAKARRYFHGKFNPDFFILVEQNGTKYILIVEIKSDGDDSDENKAKYRHAVEHFRQLNLRLEANGLNEKYIFHFLSPDGYSTFFEHLKNGTVLEGQDKYRCELENLLESVED